MRSIVINLPEDTDRLAAFRAAYPESIFGNLEVWRAKSGDDVEVPDWWQRSANRYALTVNIQDILDSVDEDVWIWEDDCIFDPVDFENKYEQFMSEVPEDADMVFLGAMHFAFPKQVSENVLKIKAAWTSHAILYKQKCLRSFADFFREPNWGCKHFSDQRRAQGIAMGKFTAYSPLYNLCGQAAGMSKINMNNRNERWYNTFRFIDLDGQIQQMRKGVLQPKEVEDNTEITEGTESTK